MELLTEKKRHAPGINREDFDNGRVNTAMSQCRKLLRLNPQDTRWLGLTWEKVTRYSIKLMTLLAVTKKP